MHKYEGSVLILIFEKFGRKEVWKHSLDVSMEHILKI